MTDIAIWKISIDIGLILALFYLGLRMSKASVNPRDTARLLGLEQTLKALLKDADSASQRLSGDLERRQKSLEQLLFDLETVEHRVNKAISNAESQRRSLSESIQPAHSNPRASGPQTPPSRESRDQMVEQFDGNQFARQSQEASEYQNISEPVQPMHMMPEPPSFSGPALTRKPRMNIYGEIIEEAQETQQQNEPPPARAQRAVARAQQAQAYSITSTQEPSQAAAAQPTNGLRSRVEKQVDSARSEAAALEQIYAVAEKLIAQGESLESVARRTRLPFKDVSMLSQILERESPPTANSAQEQAEQISVNASDERLGVLARPAMKRQTQVL